MTGPNRSSELCTAGQNITCNGNEMNPGNESRYMVFNTNADSEVFLRYMLVYNTSGSEVFYITC